LKYKSTCYQALALEAGVDGFVGKNDQPEKLREALEETLHKQ
jgi:DNA-binding NarL/FixJ family response regulator